MEISFIIIGIAAFIVICFFSYRFIKVKTQIKKREELKLDRLKPLYEILNKGKNLSVDDILPFAENLLTRYNTFHILKEYNKSELFPWQYYTLLKGAESSLANWLEFPTELGACPDEIEHIKRITMDFDGQDNFVHYEVFKYRINEPHWASKDGWILGVVGPFFDDSEPYDSAMATFSRVSSTVDKVKPEDEVKWVHENIGLRKR